LDVQRRALAVLFAVIAAGLVVTAVSAIAGAGDGARGWIIAAAALAIAGWLGSMAISAFRG
jgi:hypothetical protein